MGYQDGRVCREQMSKGDRSKGVVEATAGEC